MSLIINAVYSSKEVIDKFESIFEFEKHYDWELDNYKTKLTDSFDLYLTNVSKLLNPSALKHFYKMFCANFALKLFEKILNSNTLNSSNDDKSQGSILIDSPQIIQTVIFKQIPPKTIKKMQIYINRCLNPVIKLIQLAYANAGDKYSKLEAIKNEKTFFSCELICNSSDALNKIRYESLNDKEALGNDPNLKIGIIPDKASRLKIDMCREVFYVIGIIYIIHSIFSSDGYYHIRQAQLLLCLRPILHQLY